MISNKELETMLNDAPDTDLILDGVYVEPKEDLLIEDSKSRACVNYELAGRGFHLVRLRR